MFRGTLAAVFLLVFVTLGWAQEPPASASTGPDAKNAQQELHDRNRTLDLQYLVEIKVIESRENLLGADARADHWTGATNIRPAPPAADADVQATDVVAARDPVPPGRKETPAGPDAEVVTFQPEPDLWDDDYRHPAGSTLIAAPKMVLLPNSPASIEMTTKQSFSYLQPVSEGHYVRKQTEPLDLGVTIKLGVEPIAGDDDVVKVPTLEIQVSALDGREPVTGLEDLDVGEPIVGKRSLTTTAKMRLGETRFVPVPTGPNRHAALVVRIRRVDQELISSLKN